MTQKEIAKTNRYLKLGTLAIAVLCRIESRYPHVFYECVTDEEEDKLRKGV